MKRQRLILANLIHLGFYSII